MLDEDKYHDEDNESCERDYHCDTEPLAALQ